MKNIYAAKMLSAAAGLLFAGAGSAAAVPGLVHATHAGRGPSAPVVQAGASLRGRASTPASGGSASGGSAAGSGSVSGSGSASGSGSVSGAGLPALSGTASGTAGTAGGTAGNAQAQASADLLQASSALGKAEVMTFDHIGSSAAQATRLYSTAADKLTDAARQAENMVHHGVQAGSSTLMRVASTLNGEVSSLAVSSAAGLNAAVAAAPHVTAALQLTASAAQSQAGQTRARVMDKVGQASAALQELATLPPASGGASAGVGLHAQGGEADAISASSIG